MGSRKTYYRRQRTLVTLVGLAVAGCITSYAAEDRSTTPWLNVEFPSDSPVGVISFSLGDSTASLRGITLALSLRASLRLRNTGPKPLRGLTLLVQAHDLTPAGRASVTIPSLNVLPGEIFSVPLDLELQRPFATPRSNGALVEVKLDCVLFDDLSSYGPDQLASRRSLLVYEWEARRDRKYFRSLLQTGQTAKLQKELDFGLPQARAPELGFELLSQMPDAAVARALPVALVPFPDAPVAMLTGAARVYRNEVHAPQIQIQNRTRKTLQTIEVGWILHDNDGRDYMAGSLPAQVDIGPVQQARVSQDGILRFSHASGRPVLVDSVTAFISSVQFGDGNFWIPSRADISQADLGPSLKRAMANSPEQQRLIEIYRRKGMDALAAELKKTTD